MLPSSGWFRIRGGKSENQLKLKEKNGEGASSFPWGKGTGIRPRREFTRGLKGTRTLQRVKGEEGAGPETDSFVRPWKGWRTQRGLSKLGEEKSKPSRAEPGVL